MIVVCFSDPDTVKAIFPMAHDDALLQTLRELAAMDESPGAMESCRRHLRELLMGRPRLDQNFYKPASDCEIFFFAF